MKRAHVHRPASALPGLLGFLSLPTVYLRKKRATWRPLERILGKGVMVGYPPIWGDQALRGLISDFRTRHGEKILEGGRIQLTEKSHYGIQ
jgi:hypothetical protein